MKLPFLYVKNGQILATYLVQPKYVIVILNVNTKFYQYFHEPQERAN